MYAAPIDRRDFLRRTAALGTSLPFEGWRGEQPHSQQISSRDGFSSTTRITAA
jgi:hypothetical protein